MSDDADRYRVVWIKVSRDRRHHGWTSETESFDSEEAALEALEEPFERGVKKARAQKLVDDPDAHPKSRFDQKWETIESRKNRNLKS